MLFTPAQIEPKSFESRRNSFFFPFLPRVDASHVYVRAWPLGCFHSLISTQILSEGADRVAGQLRGDKECPFIKQSLEEGAGKRCSRVKLQALVYNTLPSTTAVFSYVIGSRRLSANEQFFVGAQTVVGLLQTTEIKQGVSFIAANKVYTSANEASIV